MNARAQQASEYAIQLEASTREAPPQITLTWKKVPAASTYTLYRKAKNATSWNTVATLSDSFYVDNDVAADTAYEYGIRAVTNKVGGYIYAGIREKAIHHRGTLILLVDTLFRDSCVQEIATLTEDLRGDGWRVIRHDVRRDSAVTYVKTIILNEYRADTSVNAVLLLGHLPVPYSGLLAPDGHNDHMGAWPADLYYGEINGTWTDRSVDNVTASRPQNKNIPGDGKFDQTQLPSDVDLQVSRIDFANMPEFAKSEVAMMKSYLNKNHLYKTGALTVIKRALIDDNFGGFGGEAFASSGWRVAPLVGRDSISAKDFLTTLNTSFYQWAYGCGAGSYTSCSGVGTTAQISQNSMNNIFTMMFGSYFGDWDATNNLLRAPLCADEPALTNVWAGRPHWYFHHMALGENIGYSTRLSQNNRLYPPMGIGVRNVHAALMGDLSLRTDYLQPVPEVIANAASSGGAMIEWTASPDTTILGYYVYRSDNINGRYEPISTIIAETEFTDTLAERGMKFYRVRPVKLQQTPSGSYYNTGLGLAVDSVEISYPTSIRRYSGTTPAVLFPNPVSSTLHIYLNAGQAQQTNLSITDVNGKLIAQHRHYSTRGANRITLPVQGLAAGLYFIRINDRDNNQVLRFTKISQDDQW